MATELLYTASGRVEIRCPLNWIFIDAITSLIPPTHWKWDGFKRIWIISPDYAETAVDLFQEYFPDGNAFIARSIGGAA